jgi:hypothetical protein
MAGSSSASPDDAGQKRHQLEAETYHRRQAPVPDLVARVLGPGDAPTYLTPPQFRRILLFQKLLVELSVRFWRLM